MAVHINALAHNTPNQGCPNSTLPAARTKPCAGKYIDIYDGFIVMWMLSKCVHIMGVGLVSLPDANVSEASRKLKSFGMNGFGTGHRGRMASRSRSAVAPTVAAASPCLRPSLPKSCSISEKYLDPMLGQQNATATAIAVRPPSINIKDVPRSGAGVRIIDGGCAWSWSIPPCRLVDDDGTKDLRLQKEAGRRRPLLERSTGPARPR